MSRKPMFLPLHAAKSLLDKKEGELSAAIINEKIATVSRFPTFISFTPPPLAVSLSPHFRLSNPGFFTTFTTFVATGRPQRSRDPPGLGLGPPGRIRRPRRLRPLRHPIRRDGDRLPRGNHPRPPGGHRRAPPVHHIGAAVPRPGGGGGGPERRARRPRHRPVPEGQGRGGGVRRGPPGCCGQGGSGRGAAPSPPVAKACRGKQRARGTFSAEQDECCPPYPPCAGVAWRRSRSE